MSETFHRKGQVELVRSRLRRIKPAETAEHPDANLLAAFAENTLPPEERATILAHLADCADCREYLALASSAASIRSYESKRRFFPVWRWAAPAAAIAAACLLVMVYQREFTTAPVPAQKKTTPPSSTVQLAVKGEPPAEVHLARKEEPRKQQARKEEAKITRTTQPTSFRAATASEPVTAAIPRPPTIPPPEVQADATVNIAENLPVPPPMPQTIIGGTVASAKNFASPPIRQAFSAPAAAFSARSSAKSRAPALLWSINAGSVQRSINGGKTWQSVPVSGQTVFRALSAEGSDIWAGGTNGALFHSSDGGLRWEQIRVGDNNAQLSGAIVSINAHNLPRIEISTDSGEQWMSEDGGVAWRRIR